MEQYFKLAGLSWSFHYEAEMVFFFENCSGLQWEKLFEAEIKFYRSLEQFIRTGKVRTIVETE